MSFSTQIILYQMLCNRVFFLDLELLFIWCKILYSGAVVTFEMCTFMSRFEIFYCFYYFYFCVCIFMSVFYVYLLLCALCVRCYNTVNNGIMQLL